MIDPKNKRIIFYQIIIWAIFYLYSIILYKSHYGINLDSQFIIKYSLTALGIFIINIWIIFNISRPAITEIEDKYLSKEKEINIEKDKLEIENRLYRILFESIDDPVFIITNKMDLFYCNNKFEKLFNITNFELSTPLIQITRNFEFQNFIQNSIVLNKQMDLSPFSFSGDMDPNRQYFHIKLIPIKFSSHYLCVLNDITERKMADQIREDFISNFSHEIRTPLTILNGQMQSLRSIVEKSENVEVDLEKHFKKIENNARRLTSLFDDMLSLTSIEKKKNLTIEEFNIEPMIDIVTQDLTLKYANKKINYEINIENDIIKADYNLLEQCLINLVDNAIKYSKDDAFIKIKSFKENNFFVINVSDNGIGIPEDQKHRIFERFFRIDISRSSEISGTGLGLAIVKHIVQKHNGKLKVLSDIGLGTSIFLYFPIVD